MSQDVGIARTYVLGFGLTASWVLVRVSVRCLVVLAGSMTSSRSSFSGGVDDADLEVLGEQEDEQEDGGSSVGRLCCCPVLPKTPLAPR